MNRVNSESELDPRAAELLRRRAAGQGLGLTEGDGEVEARKSLARGLKSAVIARGGTDESPLPAAELDAVLPAIYPGTNPRKGATLAAPVACSACGDLFTPPERPPGTPGKPVTRCQKCRKSHPKSRPAADVVAVSDPVPPAPAPAPEPEPETAQDAPAASRGGRREGAGRPALDEELRAIAAVLTALTPLDDAARRRAVGYTIARLGLTGLLI